MFGVFIVAELYRQLFSIGPTHDVPHPIALEEPPQACNPLSLDQMPSFFTVCDANSPFLTYIGDWREGASEDEYYDQ